MYVTIEVEEKAARNLRVRKEGIHQKGWREEGERRNEAVFQFKNKSDLKNKRRA